MNKLMFAVTFFASLSANASDVLVNYYRNAGFSPRPGFEQLSIYEDGKVRFHSEYNDRRTGKKETVNKFIGRLSLERTAALKDLLPQIREKDLVDKNEGQPRCTDAPSSRITAGEVQLYRRASCHTWLNEDPAAVKIKALVDGLVALENM